MTKMRVKYARVLFAIFALAVSLPLVGCSSPPKSQGNACKIFAEKFRWETHTFRAAKKWGADPAVLLAIMKQESAFQANARPPRRHFFGIPLQRPSSAFGYAQAIDSTWQAYQKDTRRRFAKRDNFEDAMDFIGWFTAQSRRRLGIRPSDGFRNYLAYHEGWGGYARGSYKKKRWLVPVAKRVNRQARIYRAQMKRCR